MKTIIQLESTSLFMEQLQPYENSRNYFHIVDSPKAQLGLYVEIPLNYQVPIIIITDKKAYFLKKR